MFHYKNLDQLIVFYYSFLSFFLILLKLYNNEHVFFSFKIRLNIFIERSLTNFTLNFITLFVLRTSRSIYLLILLIYSLSCKVTHYFRYTVVIDFKFLELSISFYFLKDLLGIEFYTKILAET